jgi:hypothetical protein
MMNAPPWIHTTTGCGPSRSGAMTLTDRQSSLIAILSVTPLIIAIRGSRDWIATGPNFVASRSPVHGSGGPGGWNRGAVAYGMPRHTRTPSRA